MKKLDPRSVIIGFLLAVISLMSLGNTNSTFDSITVREIRIAGETLTIKRADMDSDKWGYPNVHLQGSLSVTPIKDNSESKLILDPILGITSRSSTGTTMINGFQIVQRNEHWTAKLSPYQLKFEGPFGSAKFSSASLELSNTHAKPIVLISANDEDDGLIILSDRYGENQWGMTGKRK